MRKIILTCGNLIHFLNGVIVQECKIFKPFLWGPLVFIYLFINGRPWVFLQNGSGTGYKKPDEQSVSF